jgi:hypothetical protein
VSNEFRVKYVGRAHAQTTRTAYEIAKRASEALADKIVITVESTELTTLQDKIEKAKKAFEEILERRRLRDTSFLASNPPQNAGVWECQVIARKAMEELLK